MEPDYDLYLQSGTQVHECKKPDCWYCEYMHIENPSKKVDPSKRKLRKGEWTEGEVKFLVDNYPHAIKIQKALNRSKASIYSKIYFVRKGRPRLNPS